MIIKNRKIGQDNSVYIIAEIGINHNGDIEIAKKLIDVAVNAGCDAVKFQKRNPDVCVPEHQKYVKRETPWGYITYLDYKYKIEFGKKEYDIINDYCNKKNIHWFVSCWDIDSVNFITSYADSPSVICDNNARCLCNPIFPPSGLCMGHNIPHCVELSNLG